MQETIYKINGIPFKVVPHQPIGKPFRNPGGMGDGMKIVAWNARKRNIVLYDLEDENGATQFVIVVTK